MLDLRQLLLNFEAISKSLAPWPCLSQQLHMQHPQAIDACQPPFPRAHVSLATSRAVLVDCRRRRCRQRRTVAAPGSSP